MSSEEQPSKKAKTVADEDAHASAPASGARGVKAHTFPDLKNDLTHD